jgi:hypothetical protein
MGLNNTMGGKYHSNKDVIDHFKRIHCDKYDYSLVHYTGNLNLVDIICQKHGVFKQSPKKHKIGHGCHKCNTQRKRTEEEAIEEFKIKHGNKYDYSDLEYKNGSSLIKIGCPTHGWFYQKASEHKIGYGCAKCANHEKSPPYEEWLNSCVERHNNYYDYSISKYETLSKSVRIICPKHGIFTQKAGTHRNGSGCKKCGDDRKSLKYQQLFTTESYIEKLEEKHGDKYDYSKVNYTTLKNPVTLTCPKHGDFTRFPQNLLKGGGCDKCLDEIRVKKSLTKVKKHFKHNNFELVIDESKFKGFNNEIFLTCSKHGEFVRFLDMNIFVLNHPCLKCGMKISKLEQRVSETLDDLGISHIQHTRYKDDNGKIYEIDILTPDLSIGFEINGLRYHGEVMGKDSDYHRWKTEECYKRGIKLTHIYENEIIGSDHFKHKIFRELGLRTQANDSCVFEYVGDDSINDFIINNHPLGLMKNCINMVCCNDGDIYGCISFKDNTVLRVANKHDVDMSKVFQSMIRQYMNDHELNTIVSNVLFDWDDLTLFEESGFIVKDTIDPVGWKFINAKHDKIYTHDEELLADNVDKFWDTGGYLMEFLI